MDIKELKKLIQLEKDKLQEVRIEPSSPDKHLVLLKTLISMPPGEIFNTYKIRGLDSIANTIRYMMQFSKILENTQGIDIKSPEGQKQLLSIVTDLNTKGKVIQTLEDVGMKDEFQEAIKEFIDNIVSNTPTVPPEIPKTNPARPLSIKK